MHDIVFNASSRCGTFRLNTIVSMSNDSSTIFGRACFTVISKVELFTSLSIALSTTVQITAITALSALIPSIGLHSQRVARSRSQKGWGYS